MKKIMSIIAVAFALLGSANFALAAQGAVGGSSANLQAEGQDGEYHIQSGY